MKTDHETEKPASIIVVDDTAANLDLLAGMLKVKPDDPGAYRLLASVNEHDHHGADYAAQMCVEYVNERNLWDCPERGKDAGLAAGCGEAGVKITSDLAELLPACDIVIDFSGHQGTSGNAPPGLYCYNYALHSDVRNLQPSGAINMNVFSKIELEFTTIVPTLDPLAQIVRLWFRESGYLIGLI